MAETGTQKVTLIGGALAVFAASLCCLGPLVLVTLGVSGAWISNLAALEPYRPVFIGAALVLMGFAWRRIYRVPAAEACLPGSVCAVPQIIASPRLCSGWCPGWCRSRWLFPTSSHSSTECSD